MYRQLDPDELDMVPDPSLGKSDELFFNLLRSEQNGCHFLWDKILKMHFANDILHN